MQIGQVPKQIELLDEGIYAAVIAAIQDLGMVPKDPQFVRAGQPKEAPMVRVWYLFSELNKDGEQFAIRKDYTNSLGKLAKLREVVKAATGTDPQTPTLDDEVLLGKQVAIRIEYQQGKDGRTWMKIADISKALKGAEKVEVPSTWQPAPVEAFNRNTPTQRTAATASNSRAQQAANDEDIAF